MCIQIGGWNIAINVKIAMFFVPNNRNLCKKCIMQFFVQFVGIRLYGFTLNQLRTYLHTELGQTYYTWA